VSRRLYYLLLQLHPPGFRYRFATEMLWIFDEISGSGRRSGLLVDGIVSLGRQWLLRSGLWKFVIGAALNAVVVIFSIIGPEIFGPRRAVHCLRPPTAVSDPSSSGLDGAGSVARRVQNQGNHLGANCEPSSRKSWSRTIRW
jgi:hypothetical protein